MHLPTHRPVELLVDPHAGRRVVPTDKKRRCKERPRRPAAAGDTVRLSDAARRSVDDGEERP